jgi:hypothetical protein
MRINKLVSIFLALSFMAVLSSPAFAQQSQSARLKSQNSTDGKTDARNQSQTEDSESGKADAADRFRRLLPVVPGLVRGSDALLSLFGRRATQNQFTSSTNVKDPALDSLPFTAGLPIEAAEPVLTPAEQFAVSHAKFYATVPMLDPISNAGWHYNFGSPFLSFKHDDGVKGLRSAAPQFAITGPVGRFALYQSFSYRLSRATVENIEDEHNDTQFQSYDTNTHVDIQASRSHTLTARLALFSQDIDFALLNALTPPEATPDYLLRGGQLFFSDAYTAQNGTVLDSSLAARKLRLRVLPRRTGPMIVEEQAFEGDYFDALRRASSRVEWKESLRLPERDAWGKHQLTLSGGWTRSAFDSTRTGSGVILSGEDEDELFMTTTFTGTPFESLSAHEFTGWIEDRWSPNRRAQLTLGLRYDRTTHSRQNEWAPRLGFALLPFNNDRTVIRGGAGVFYDILPLTAATFTRSRQRVVQFFDEGVPEGEPRALLNLATRPHLKTSYTRGWNLEVDQQIGGNFFVRVKAEDRRGRSLPLINPDSATREVTALVLSDSGTSRYREIETTLVFRPGRRTNLNASYIRSSAVGDSNLFTSVMGLFEKPFIGRNRYVRARSDAPHRFVAWGDFRAPKDVIFTSALDIHTGFPFSFFDGDASVPNESDFGRLPRFLSLDLGAYKDFSVKAFDGKGKLRVGVMVYNATNHFNPNDAETDENEEETAPVLKRFLNSAGRTYRMRVTLDF